MRIVNRRELLFRKNKGKLFIDNYIRKITDLINIDINSIKFEGVEESERIRYLFYDKNKTYQKCGSSNLINSENVTKEILITIKENAQNNCYVFIDRDWEYCGCFLLEDIKLLKENFIFGNSITDDIYLIDNEYKHIYHLDYYEEKDSCYIDFMHEYV